MVKVVVIDTGIDFFDEELSEYCKKMDGLEIFHKQDTVGHGTMVCKIIKGICPKVEIYSINIFGNHTFTTSKKLLMALKKVVGTDIKILNISASTINQDYRKCFEDICKKLVSEGKIIVAAGHSYDFDNNCIPGTIDGVIGVRESFDNSVEEYIYDRDALLQMCINNYGMSLKHNLNLDDMSGTSRGCAITTGIIANIINENENETLGFEEIENLLIGEST